MDQKPARRGSFLTPRIYIPLIIGFLILDVILVVVLFFLPQEMDFTPPGNDFPDVKLQQQVQEAEQKWNKLGITNYKIEVAYGSTISGRYTHSVTVLNSRVSGSSASCERSPSQEAEACTPYYGGAKSPEDITVPGLFKLATRVAPYNGMKDLWEPKKVQIGFHSTYFFPASLNYKIDTDGWNYYINVTSFSILP